MIRNKEVWSCLLYLNVSRERRDVLLNTLAGRRSRPLTNNEDAEFATGLIIGEWMLNINDGK